MKKIYMLAGKARAGKDTTAGYIKKYYEEKDIKVCILQIATPLKYYAEKALNWDLREETKPREFLQNIGDYIRKTNGEDSLIKRLVEDMKVLFNYVDVIVISDVRIPIEFEEVSKSFDDVINILIERPNFENNLTGAEKSHKTETALDGYNNYKYIVKNDGTLLDLKTKTEEILKVEI